MRMAMANARNIVVTIHVFIIGIVVQPDSFSFNQMDRVVIK
jgi:hypothetical protein